MVDKKWLQLAAFAKSLESEYVYAHESEEMVLQQITAQLYHLSSPQSLATLPRQLYGTELGRLKLTLITFSLPQCHYCVVHQRASKGTSPSSSSYHICSYNIL